MPPLGYQLYSSRNFPLAETLTMVADIGYSKVEGYGALFEDPDAITTLQAGLAKTGLTMPTAHFGIDMVRDTPTEVITTCAKLGIETVVYPYLDPDARPSNAKGWADLGADLATYAKPLTDAGLGIAWHNHDFEVVDLGIPETPLDLIMQASDEMLLELDLAWVHIGGRDPIDFLQQYATRMVVAHLKDVAPQGENANEDGWADLGHGRMDWATLYAEIGKTAAQHLIVEHDNPSDHKRFAQRSFDTVANF